MIIHIVFDGQERHEFVTNEVDELKFSPVSQPLIVGSIVKVLEEYANLHAPAYVTAEETKPHTPAQ